MKPKFFMTIGIAGCGKSTWAKNNLNIPDMFEEIYSSDEYREKLLGDINDQNHNGLIFDTLHKDIISALKNGKSVCCDATNLTIKRRATILNLIKQNKINCDKIAVLFEIEPFIIYRQNSERERKVPEHVIDKMIKQFEIPFINEGFDAINIIYRKENDELRLFDIQKSMYRFNQDNPHHSKDLLDHCNSAYSNLLGKTENAELLLASSIHDFGKIYTKTFDEEKKYSHFIGHENYGAYTSLFIDWHLFMVDKEKIAFYINYHMIPYRLNNAKESTLNKYKNLFGDEWENIMKLHQADELAH